MPDKLAPARGVLLGVVLGFVVWMVVFFVIVVVVGSQAPTLGQVMPDLDGMAQYYRGPSLNEQAIRLMQEWQGPGIWDGYGTGEWRIPASVYTVLILPEQGWGVDEDWRFVWIDWDDEGAWVRANVDAPYCIGEHCGPHPAFHAAIPLVDLMAFWDAMAVGQ